MRRGYVMTGVSMAACVMMAGLLAVAWQSRQTGAGVVYARWADATTYTYALTYGSSAETIVPALAAGGQEAPPYATTTSCRATLTQTLWQRRPDGIDIFVNLAPKGPGAVIACLVHMTASGRLQGVTFSMEVSAAHRQLMRAVLAATQVDAGAPDGGRRWQVQELDLNGCWPVAYERGPATQSQSTFFKRPGGGRMQSGLEVRRRGSLQGALARPQGHLMRLAGRTRSEFWDGARRLAADDVEVDLRLVSVGGRDDAVLRVASALAAEVAAARPPYAASSAPSLGGGEAQAALRQAELSRVLGDATAASLQQSYEADDGTDGARLLQLSQRLEALLELKPAAGAGLCVDLLSRLDPGCPAFSSVAASLTYVGHAAAQDALRRSIVARGAAWPAAVRRLATHLAMVDRPEVRSVDVLQVLADTSTDRGVMTSARLGLGTMARALLGSCPGRADAIFRAAAARLVAGDDVMLHLQVLGNIGHPAQVDVVGPLLDSRASAHRSPALYSLRFVATAAARQRLATAAETEADAGARARATEALGFAPPTSQLVAKFTQQLEHEQDVGVLREVLRNLSRAAPACAAARTALDDFIARCGHPDLCAFATSLRQVTGVAS